MAKVSVGVFDNGHGVHPTIICGEQNIVDYLNELFKGTGEEPFTLQDVRVMAAYHNSRWFNKRDDDTKIKLLQLIKDFEVQYKSFNWNLV